ncbi:hypothetical protein [Solilutibacter silvestris]|uniref:hypothetical protein n=1 Tax=Solilutibacter silvestris TaxID=1645665 RepID=UPI003D32E833
MNFHRPLAIATAVIVAILIFTPHFVPRNSTITQGNPLADKHLSERVNDVGLTPCDDPYPTNFQNDRNPKDYLFKDSPLDSLFYVVEIPSFSPPSGISVSSTQIFSATYADMPNEHELPRITHKSTEIDQKLAFKSEDVIRRETIYASSLPTLGMDGTQYFFYHHGKCAYTWSPKWSSRAGKLTMLYVDLAKGSRNDSAIYKLIQEIEALETR